METPKERKMKWKAPFDTALLQIQTRATIHHYSPDMMGNLEMDSYILQMVQNASGRN